jgi:RNA polymerase sigma-70 factor (ECF subfamily)
MAASLAGEQTSPSLAAIRGEMMTQLEAALDRLDPIDREVLALRHFEELSNNEVAALLGIQKAAASKRYVRALERLKGALAEIPGFFEDHA